MSQQDTESLLNQLNTQKILVNASLTAVFFTMYGMYYDFVMCKMPFTAFNVLIKVIFILVPLIILYPFKKLTLYQRTLILLTNYTLYCPYYIINVSIAYVFASLQLFFITSNIFLLEKRDYLILSIFIFTSTLVAISLSNNPYPQLENLDALSSVISENFVSLFALCFISYFYTHSKRIAFLKKEFRFSNIGKTSSFLIHEISKPIFNKSSAELESSETKNLKDLINITKYMISGNIPESEFQEINLNATIQNIITNLDSSGLVKFLDIKINIIIEPDIFLKTSQKGFEIIIANLIKNALEALAPYYDKEEYRKLLIIEINYNSEKNILTISNPIFDLLAIKNFHKWSDINFTTKDGHQGVGLHIAHTLCSKCHLKISNEFVKNTVYFNLHLPTTYRQI